MPSIGLLFLLKCGYLKVIKMEVVPRKMTRRAGDGGETLGGGETACI